MKLGNYQPQDMESVIEFKKLIQHHIEKIEQCNWTDEIDEALIRSENLQKCLVQLRKMKMEKVLDGSNFLAEKLKAQGINAVSFKFTHKKAD